MLSIFPSLLAYGMIGTTLLRLSLGVVFLILGYRTFKRDRENFLSFFHKLGLRGGLYLSIVLALVEIIVGIFLLIGLYTQVAAIIALIISLKILLLNFLGKKLTSETSSFYILTAVISASLIFLGAGVIALDLPL